MKNLLKKMFACVLFHAYQQNNVNKCDLPEQSGLIALELVVLLNESERGSNSFKMLTLTLFSSSGCMKSIKFCVSVMFCVSIFNLLSDLAGDWECVEDAVDNLELAEELLGNTRGGGGVGWFLGGNAGGV